MANDRPVPWTDWARVTLLEVAMGEIGRTRRLDWPSIGEKWMKTRAEEDEEGENGWFERKGVSACRSQLNSMCRILRFWPERLPAHLMARVRDYISLRDDVEGAARLARLARGSFDDGDGVGLVAPRSTSDAGKAIVDNVTDNVIDSENDVKTLEIEEVVMAPSTSDIDKAIVDDVADSENDVKDREIEEVMTADDHVDRAAASRDDEKDLASDGQFEEYWTASSSAGSERDKSGEESEPESRPIQPGARELHKRLPAPSPAPHTEGQGGRNPPLDLDKLEQLLHIFEKQEARSRVFMESLFRGMPKNRVFLDHVIAVSTAQSAAEKQDCDRHRCKRMRVIPPNCAAFNEIEWKSTRRVMRYQIMATFERFHAHLAALFRQTSCDLLDLVPQFVEFLKTPDSS